MKTIATYRGPGPEQGWYTKDNKLNCYEQGYELMTSIAKHHLETPEVQQGWYTDRGDLVYGFYCE